MSYIEWSCEECIHFNLCFKKGNKSCNDFWAVENDEDNGEENNYEYQRYKK